MRMPANKDLSLVLNPLALADFMDQYWERESLHIERNDPEHFAAILRLADIETLLSSQELLFPAVQLSRKHSPVAVAAYTDNGSRIVPGRLINEYHQGASIVMSAAHQSLPALAELRRGVQAGLGLRCQTNLYLSPPGEQGFGAHYDSHDVFILQVQGSKTFNFYEGGIERPYSHEGFDAGVHKPGKLAESVTVNAGDTLYIPRGVFHDAVARESESLHITLGVYAMTLREVLLEMVDVITETDPRYRRSVPAQLWQSPGLTPSVASAQQETELLQDLLSCSLQEEHWQTARARLLNAISLDNTQDCTGLLTGSPVEWESGTVIRLKPGAEVATERHSGRLYCRVPGQVLELTDPMAQAFELLASRQMLSLSDWDNLDEEQKQALCEQLLQANVIEIVNAREMLEEIV